MKIQKRENFSLLFVQRVDKVLNFLYNKGGKDRKLHKLCRRYAVCFRYFCDVSYPQLRELKPNSRANHVKRHKNVSYPQLRELKHQANAVDQILPDVSYPQLRELKLKEESTVEEVPTCILPAAAGIETKGSR